MLSTSPRLESSSLEKAPPDEPLPDLTWRLRWMRVAETMATMQDPHVGGWFSPAESHMLRDICLTMLPDTLAVEIGSFMGKSTRWAYMGTLFSGAQLACVDPFTSSGAGEPEHIVRFYRKLAPHGSFSVWVGNLSPFTQRLPQEEIEVHLEESRKAAASWGDRKISVLFIDGLHTECLLDLQAWLPHLEDHAMVLMHDVNGSGAYGESGPDNTYYHMIQGGWTPYGRADSLAALTRDPGWWHTRYESINALISSITAGEADNPEGAS